MTQHRIRIAKCTHNTNCITHNTNLHLQIVHKSLTHSTFVSYCNLWEWHCHIDDRLFPGLKKLPFASTSEARHPKFPGYEI